MMFKSFSCLIQIRMYIIPVHVQHITGFLVLNSNAHNADETGNIVQLNLFYMFCNFFVFIFDINIYFLVKGGMP